MCAVPASLSIYMWAAAKHAGIVEGGEGGVGDVSQLMNPELSTEFSPEVTNVG